MALLDLCPRCRATIRAGQLVCARCGLHLDDKRLQTGALQLQPPVTAPLTQAPSLRRRNKAATGLIAVLALLALTVAVGMAQPLIGTRTSADGPASVATQT